MVRAKVIMLPHNHEYIFRLKEELEKEGVKIALLKPFHYSTLANFLKVFFLKFKGYRIIHVHWLYVFPFFWLMKLFVKFSKKLGYKIVWTVHNILPHERRKGDIEMVRWFYKNADYKFIHYKINLENLKKILNVEPENIEVIYHPIFDAYPNEISKEEARKKLGIPVNKKILLCFGMIRKYKGMELFADAMEKLGNDYIGIIAGKRKSKEVATYLKKKEKELENLIVVDKFIPDENVQIYFNACDVVVLPYTSITTSGVVSLAYSFAKPVITTNVGGLPEIVINGKTGFLVEPNNTDALVKAIKEIFNMDYEKMGKEAYKMAKERYTWKRLAEQTIKVYEKVLKNEDK